MKINRVSIQCLLCTTVFVAILTSAPAQVTSGLGPDVIVGDIMDVSNYGSSNGIAAFSIGTTSCNIGTQPLNWIASTNQHPVISQTMYRLKGGRMEQIGMSWLKHGFTALNGNLCNTCQPTGGSTLGVGCSDPYGSGLNGQQSNLGPRSEVNAATGVFLYPWVNTGSGGTNIAKRLQVQHADLDPAQNVGAEYLVEAHYITQDDTAALNALNNASYRKITVTPTVSASGPSYDIALTGTTVQGSGALRYWQTVDPVVILEDVDVPGDGRFTVAFRSYPVAGNVHRYEYAIHNLNSDRSAGAVEVALPATATVTNIGFHDVDYHSGEPYSGTDWVGTQAANGVRWATTPYTTDQNANALRWATTYNFWFESDLVPGALTIELFKPGTPASVTAASVALCPPQPATQLIHSYAQTPNPAYDYLFIVPFSTSPLPLAAGLQATIPIGFSFPFYSTTLTEIVVGPRGYLTVPGQPGDVSVNQALPDIQQPNGVIAAYWDDLNTALGGVVRYANDGVAPNRRLVVEYFGIPQDSDPTQTESFQYSLYEDGKITMSWMASSQFGASATIGLERPDGGAGMTLSHNAAGIATPNTTREFIRAVVGATTADLTLTGNGVFGTQMNLALLSTPQRGFLLMGDQARGPTWLSPVLPPLDLGFSPLFRVVLDGVGLFGLPDPSAVTDGCGQFSLTFTSPFPSGFDYTLQGVVVEAVAPVPILHFTNSQRIVVP